MISEIEKKPEEDFEYIVNGEKKTFVPSHHHKFIDTDKSIDMLKMENIVLRFNLKNGLGRRIEELELSELLLKGENKNLKDENEKLKDKIKLLEEKLRAK